jgi:Protein of unknown function (DUF2442)
MSISTNSDPLAHPRAAAVAVEADVLRVTLRDGRTITAPLGWFEWLSVAGEEQRRDFAIIGEGAGIWWGALDEGVSVASLFGLPEDL